MKNRILTALILGLGVAYLGCSSGRTLVMNIPSERVKVVALAVAEDKPTIGVPPEAMKMFREKLENTLFVGDEESPPPFKKGADLTIRYRFIQYTPGSQFKRIVSVGIGGYGEGSINVEARFITPEGKELSNIQAEGKSGSMESAIEKCVAELVQYARQNYR